LNIKASSYFKFTLYNNYKFNYKILIDIIYLNSSKPVLYVINLATVFNIITTDVRLNFYSTKFKYTACRLSIKVKKVPIKAYYSIRKVKRYHIAFYRIYKIIYIKSNVKPKVALQLAIKATNNTASLDGLIPTLLVFKVYPYISNKSPPTITTIQ
ncbi:hypothetical protein LZ31DRAFT_483228, partial [Colletotrichum somersetense]